MKDNSCITDADLQKLEAIPEKRLLLSDFSFSESQELLKTVKGSLSEAIIDEKRNDM